MDLFLPFGTVYSIHLPPSTIFKSFKNLLDDFLVSYFFQKKLQMCQMEFEVLGKTDNWLQLQKDGIGVKFMGMAIMYSDVSL